MIRTLLQKPEIEISLSASYPITPDLGMYLNMHPMQLQVPIQIYQDFYQDSKKNFDLRWTI